MKKYLSWKILVVVIVALFLGYFDAPNEVQKTIIPDVPKSILDQKLHLGLDLQGGAQLDFKIDMRKVPENDRENIIDGVMEVIEKRVNRLGVSEPNIYSANYGDEAHIIVELAETNVSSQEDVDTYLSPDKKLEELNEDEKKIISLEKAKATVGKTIQLEFKEEKKTMDPQEKDKVKELAQKALDKINGGTKFSVVGQEDQQAFPGKVSYETRDYTFESQLDTKTKENLSNLEIGYNTKSLIELSGNYTIKDGEFIEDSNYSILKLVDKKEEVKNAKEVDVNHILIAYSGAQNADSTVTRNEDEAYTLAKEVKEKLGKGEDFSQLAKENSDDTSNKENGGKLTDPVSDSSNYDSTFTEAALKLTKVGELSDIVKTPFGYHIIKAEQLRENVKELKYKYEIISYSTVPDPWQATGLTGEHFVRADVEMDSYFKPYITLQFNDEGGKLFGEITGRNIGKKVAIFVGGEKISDPVVNEKIETGSAQITGRFTADEAKQLARDLNTGAIPAPIILAGEYTIGATLGQEALSNSIWAGLAGLVLIMIFMTIYYRLPGFVASIALAMYSIILLFLIKSSLHLGIALLISLVIFIFLIFKVVNNKDSAWEKFLSFLLSCVAFFFLTYLLKTGVVLTLAGVAGIIISIGMAVDANVLIFERVKEELNEGKTLRTAVDNGFTRAWSSIRDSNFSTLITCAVLFYFGSSIIKGFAFNLSAGIIVSMFTAITITRLFLYAFIESGFAKYINLFKPSSAKKSFNYDFIKNSKMWLSISGILFVIAILAIGTFGLNLGLDFKGGSLMELQFKQEITKEKIESSIKEIGVLVNKEIEDSTLTTNTSLGSTSDLKGTVETQKVEKINFDKLQILPSSDNTYIIKTEYLSSDTHDKIIKLLKEKLPEFTEPRFTTIGPTIGKTMLNKALIAIIATSLIIIIYIAMAFRKISKEVSAWRFGVSAIIALIHDITIVTGLFVILGQFVNAEIDSLFITAMLTILGYSVNDTIVVYDRIRENVLKSKGETIEKITNTALNQTMGRSFNTTISTIIPLFAILLMGYSTIFYFILALTAGIIFGAYSSIFVASPILVYWSKWADKK